MESNIPRASTGFGPLKDLHNLKQNGSASVAELKEFLGKLQGHSPQEVVGLVSTSMLVQSMILSTVGVVAILAIFTIGPYLVFGAPQEKKTAATSPASAAPASPAAAPAAEAGQSGQLSTDDKTKAMQKMGIDETKTSDPKVNPLEKNLDNLLDNVK